MELLKGWVRNEERNMGKKLASEVCRLDLLSLGSGASSNFDPFCHERKIQTGPRSVQSLLEGRESAWYFGKSKPGVAELADALDSKSSGT